MSWPRFCKNARSEAKNDLAIAKTPAARPENQKVETAVPTIGESSIFTSLKYLPFFSVR